MRWRNDPPNLPRPRIHPCPVMGCSGVGVGAGMKMYGYAWRNRSRSTTGAELFSEPAYRDAAKLDAEGGGCETVNFLSTLDLNPDALDALFRRPEPEFETGEVVRDVASVVRVASPIQLSARQLDPNSLTVRYLDGKP